MQMDKLIFVFYGLSFGLSFVFFVPFGWLFHWMSHLLGFVERSELVVCLCKLSGFLHGNQIEVKGGRVSNFSLDVPFVVGRGVCLH